MMQTAFSELKRGDRVRIRFGSKSSQVAIVHDWTRAGNCRVWKFSANRRVWKGPLRLYDGELIEILRHDAELRNPPPLPPEYGQYQYPSNPIREA